MKLVLHLCLGLLALGGCTPNGQDTEPNSKATANVPASNKPKSIVLITIDTLRADHTGLGGYTLPTTPFLDELGKSGVVFTHAYANSSFTPTSMASVMTGLHSRSHGVEDGRFDRELGHAIQDRLPESINTLAESMKALGYVTIGIPSNRHLAQDLGFGQGFDYYYAPATFGPAQAVNARAHRQIKAAVSEGRIDGRAPSNLFLWVHYFDPHSPYTHKPAWTAKHSPSLSQAKLDELGSMNHKDLGAKLENNGFEDLDAVLSLYDGNIRHTDNYIRRLWDEYKFDDDTLLIVTSDHGEEFYEHDDFGHAKTLYNEVVHVPFMVRWPAALPKGKTLSRPISILDVYPTILELTGATTQGDLHGESLVALMKGKESERKKPLLLELKYGDTHWNAQIKGSQKLIRALEPTPWVGSFNLSLDPGEKTNLFENGMLEAASPQARQGIQSMDLHFASLPPPPKDGGQTTITSEEEVEALRAMGYID